MKKIHCLTALLVVIFSIKTTGQTHLEFNIGPSFTNVVSGSGGFFETQEEFSTGFLTTLTVDTKIGTHFHAGGGLGYYQKGFEFDVRTFDENAQFTGTNRVAASYNYLGVPVFIGLRTNSNYSFVAETGMVFATLVGDQIKNETTGQSEDLRQPKNFDFSVFSQYGIQKQVSELVAIKLAVSAYLSLTDLELFDYRHLTLNVQGGILYRLKTP